MGQTDGRADEDLVARIAGGEPADEAAVDLERVERQLVEQRQGRVSGAEVIEVQADPIDADIGDDPAGSIGILEQRALGDLEPEHMRGQVVGSDRLPDRVGESRILDLPGGDIDAHIDVVLDQPVAAPGGESASAWSSTWEPSALIIPVSSAIRMNSIGGTCPQASGQRASASRARIWPSRRSTIGW